MRRRKVTIRQVIQAELTVKALLSPRGAYLVSDLPEGLDREVGLLERGACSQNQVTRKAVLQGKFHLL